MRQLGVEMIPAYSAQARERCERMFAAHQKHDRREFTVPAAEPGTTFVPFIGPGLTASAHTPAPLDHKTHGTNHQRSGSEAGQVSMCS